MGLMPRTGLDVAPPPDDPSVVPEDAEESSTVTDQEQGEKDEFYMHAVELIYGEGKVNPVILKLLDEDPEDLKQVLGDVAEAWDQPVDPNDPSKGTVWEADAPIIALAATSVIVVLEVQRRYGDDQPDGSIVFHGGKDIIEDLAEVAGKYGAYEYTDAEISEAFRKGTDLYREAAKEEGLINEDELKQEFSTILQADQEGQLNKVLPGINQPPEHMREEEEQEPASLPEEEETDELRG